MQQPNLSSRFKDQYRQQLAEEIEHGLQMPDRSPVDLAFIFHFIRKKNMPISRPIITAAT